MATTTTTARAQAGTVQLSGKVFPGFSGKPSAIDAKESVSSVARKGRNFFVVTDEKKFYGMVLESAILLAEPGEKAKTIAFSPPVLSATSTVKDALEFFASSGLQELPVVDKGNLVGEVKVTTILSALDFSRITTDEVMNRHPYTVGDSSKVADLRELMSRGRVRRVYVVAPSGDLSGVVTHSAILSKPFQRKDERRVSEVMFHDVFFVSPSDPLKKAVAAMVKHGVQAVAVADGGRLIGEIECKHLIRKYLDAQMPTSGISVQIVGLVGLESFERASINALIFDSMRKLGKSLGPSTTKVVFKRIAKGWEIKLSLEQTDGRKTSVGASGFDPLSATSEALRTLERRVRHG